MKRGLHSLLDRSFILVILELHAGSGKDRVLLLTQP